MMKTRFFIISLLSISFFMMSFAPQKEVSSLKRKWMLIEFQGFTKEELIQEKAYLDLTHLEKGGGAKMGCNSIFFSVKLKNNHRIHFSGVGSTIMYCDGSMKLEENFGKLLPTITNYRDWETDRKSTRLNFSHRSLSRMPSSA